MTSNQKATLLALSAVLLWSTVATAFKIALRELLFLPITFNFYHCKHIDIWMFSSFEKRISSSF
jgi:hypothetical protein